MQGVNGVKKSAIESGECKIEVEVSASFKH